MLVLGSFEFGKASSEEFQRFAEGFETDKEDED
jgi:hypothetical protein